MISVEIQQNAKEIFNKIILDFKGLSQLIKRS